ncbi:MAG TPA: O-antigen ligase family protein, partial [Gemmatimonadales bacterium]|nr:O-antigen ligase family protein [Gemmatimonadales bacterium]
MLLGFVPGLLDPFTPAKAALVRVVGIGALVALGPAAFARRTWPRRTCDRAVVAWVAVTLVSAALAVSPRLAWFGEIGSREGVLTTLGLAGLYAVARRAGSAPDHEAHRVSLLIACATAASIYALLQRAGADPLTWAAPAAYRVAGASVLRPWGPLGNPILLGIVAACGLAAAIARLARPASDPWRLAPIAAVNGAACAATLSRGAWLAAMVGTLVACIAAARVRPIPRARLIGIVSLFSVVVAWTLIVQRIATAARVAEGLAPGTSLDVRGAIASAALSAWRSRPVWGVGPDGFALAFPRWRGTAYWRGVWLENPVHAHAVPLQVLATLGIAGVLAGAAIVASALFAARARWRRRDDQLPPTLAVLATLAAASLTNVVGIAGAVIAATFGAALVGGDEPPRAPRVRGLAVAAGVLTAGVLAFAT